MAGYDTKRDGNRDTRESPVLLYISKGQDMAGTDTREQGHGFELGSLAWIKGVTLILDQRLAFKIIIVSNVKCRTQTFRRSI